MQQLHLFPPQKGCEETYATQLQLFANWAREGKISWKQWQNFRRQLEYNIIMHRRRNAQ